MKPAWSWIGYGSVWLVWLWVTAFIFGLVSVNGVSGYYLTSRPGGNLLFWTVPLAIEFARGTPRQQTLDDIERDFVPAITKELDTHAMYSYCRTQGFDDLDCRAYIQWKYAKR